MITGLKLEDGSEILEDFQTETTRFVLYRHGKTGNLNMAMQQSEGIVSVRTDNLRFLLAEIVAKHEPSNE